MSDISLEVLAIRCERTHALAQDAVVYAARFEAVGESKRIARATANATA